MNEYDQNPPDVLRPNSNALTSHGRDVRMWGMILHLSVLAGFVIPVVGWVASIVIWQVKEHELPEIDQHGKTVVNWVISGLIYTFICFLLMFILIGIQLIVVLGIVRTVFPMIGEIKAHNREY